MTSAGVCRLVSGPSFAGLTALRFLAMLTSCNSTDHWVAHSNIQCCLRNLLATIVPGVTVTYAGGQLLQRSWWSWDFCAPSVSVHTRVAERTADYSSATCPAETAATKEQLVGTYKLRRSIQAHRCCSTTIFCKICAYAEACGQPFCQNTRATHKCDVCRFEPCSRAFSKQVQHITSVHCSFEVNIVSFES